MTSVKPYLGYFENSLNYDSIIDNFACSKASKVYFK